MFNLFELHCQQHDLEIQKWRPVVGIEVLRPVTTDDSLNLFQRERVGGK
jgi:hypothetical protein